MPCEAPVLLAGHEVRRDALGRLAPWAPWSQILELEMRFYQTCPTEHGYPRFACETFLDADWNPGSRSDIIPATQNGMGILSHLKYAAFAPRAGEFCLRTARAFGDYLVNETLTPAGGVFARFTRSTGRRGFFPQPADAGSQSDRPFEIEPDKGGIAGYALLELLKVTGDARYLAQALQNARVLSATQRAGTASSSPWPFRVDYRSGEGRGPICGNLTYILRLYDELLALGFAEFTAPRAALWQFIEREQIPNAAGDGALFAQFFEDHDTPTNRSAWAPLNLARYLLEQRAALSADWLASAGILLDFVRRTFTHIEAQVTVCHEQDEDAQAWGGINSTYGAVLALYAAASGREDLRAQAWQALNYTLYSIDELGRPRDVLQNPNPGGWQEDAHTDVIHNYIDALRVFPEWSHHGP